MDKPNSSKKRSLGLILGIVISVVLVAGVVSWVLFDLGAVFFGEDQPAPTNTTEPSSSTAETEPTDPDLGEGLEFVSMGRYEGSFMEDGTNDRVSDVMSIVVQNTSDRDLQLAQIEITFPSLTAQFQVTNLPAGEQVLLLEQNRALRPEEDMTGAVSKNVVFFDEPMNLMEDRLSIIGADGSVTVSNVSEEDMTGNIYIYYKNEISDLLYGGITYRVCIEGGLAAGETRTISSGHYHPETSRLLQATCVG